MTASLMLTNTSGVSRLTTLLSQSISAFAACQTDAAVDSQCVQQYLDSLGRDEADHANFSAARESKWKAALYAHHDYHAANK